MKGLVYLFRQTGTSFCKIGYTLKSDVNARFSTFKMYSPLGAEILSTLETDNAMQLEKEMHLLFKDYRTNGEFFSLTEEQIKIFKSYETSKSKDLQNIFWLIVSNNDFTIEDVKFIFKKNIASIDSLEDNAILEHLNDNYTGSKFTNHQINEIIKNDLQIELSQKALGKILQKKYNQKIKKINGSFHRIYQL